MGGQAMGSKNISVFPNHGGMLVGHIVNESETGVAVFLPGSPRLLIGQEVRADYAGFAMPASVESTLRSLEGMQVELRFADPTAVLRSLH